MKRNYILIIIILIIIGCESSNLVDPTLVLNYTIKKKAHVKLQIENSYNTIIKVLVDEEKNAGLYNVSFNAKNLAEGVYFYTIEAKGIDNDYYYKKTHNVLLAK